MSPSSNAMPEFGPLGVANFTISGHNNRSTMYLLPSKKISIYLAFGVLCLSGFLSSCSEDAEIKSYVIPNRHEGPVVTWMMPDGWGENPNLSGPLAGSFHVVTETGPKGNIGVMPFREAVSSLDIANMFARELGYGPLGKDDLDQLIRTKKIGEREFEWIRMKEQLASENPRLVILALLRQDSETWLFPFIADHELARKEMNNYSDFLKSVVVRAGKKPIKAQTMAASSAPSAPPQAHDAPLPTWEAPDHWLVGKKSSMRVGSYSVEGSDGESLDFSITTFPGDVGGLLANVNRWLEQVGLQKVDKEGLSEYLSPIKLDGKPAQLVVAENDEQSLYAAMYFGSESSWFIKIMGDSTLAKVEKNNFLNLLNSFCFHDH